MDETEILKTLSELGGKEIGILSTIGLVVFWIYKKFNVIVKLLNLFYEEKIFEKFNSNLRFITEKRSTYKFKTAYFKKDSQDIFNTLRHIYDVNSLVNIDLKILNFKLYELHDNSILFANLCRFCDYYKGKNGIKINFFLSDRSSADDTNSTNLISDLKNYIEKSQIHGIKIISSKEVK